MGEPGERAAQAIEPPTYTLRLTFTYNQSDLRIVAVQRVAMIPPPGEPQPIHPGQAGFWVELRGGDDDLLYQRVLHTPFRYEVEVFEERSIHSEKINSPQGMFELLVPDIPQAQTLRLFGSPPEPEAVNRSATELARFDLDVERRRAEGAAS